MKYFWLVLLGMTSWVLRAELVSMDVSVRDGNGLPVEDAEVTLRVAKKQISFPGQRLFMPFQKIRYKTFSFSTGKDGWASDHFFYWGFDIDGCVKKDGYYDQPFTTKYRTSYKQKLDKTLVLEDEKTIRIVLLEKINPIPLYAYRGRKRFTFREEETTVGYDLKLRKPLPPYGSGEVADFYVQHEMVSSNDLRYCTAKIFFPEGGGAYVVRRNEDWPWPMVYQADTNAVYMSEVKNKAVVNVAEKRYVSSDNLLTAKDALVIRSRVVKDDRGQMVSANYSKIYGPMTIAWVLEFEQSCFNPVVNDTNLELDKFRKLSKKEGGIFYP